MKNHKNLIFITTFILLTGIGIWWKFGQEKFNLRNTKPTDDSKTTVSTSPIQQPASPPKFSSPIAAQVLKPIMFKSTSYPPKTPEEKAMWDWWNYMRKTDPDFEWKSPIEFYGKVLDQNNSPVYNASVECNWAALPGEDNRKVIQSGIDGSFLLRNVHGKVLSISVTKNDYVTSSGGRGGFEYTAFFEPDFHVPNPSAPVIFHLWKLGNAEPMYLWSTSKDLTVDGKPYPLNVKTGKNGGDDLTFIVTRSNQSIPRQFDYTLTVKAGIGGGLVESNDELMFSAPESGYKPSITLMQKFGSPDYNQAQKLRFYLKTQDGKYAAVEAEVMQHTAPTAQAQMVIYYNPSGSRNLEYDYKKQINK